MEKTIDTIYMHAKEIVILAEKLAKEQAEKQTIGAIEVVANEISNRLTEVKVFVSLENVINACRLAWSSYKDNTTVREVKGRYESGNVNKVISAFIIYDGIEFRVSVDVVSNPIAIKEELLKKLLPF